MGKEKSVGLMEQIIRDNIWKGRSMGLECFSEMMGIVMRVTLKKVKLMAKENIIG